MHSRPRSRSRSRSRSPTGAPGRAAPQPPGLSAAEDARILRRIDTALLPLMLAVYFLQALDKATLSYAALFGLIEDTGLAGADLSWLGSVVYVAQLLMQPPVAWLLVRLPVARFTSAMVLAWGVALVGMAAARDFRQLLAARFLLGACEACVGPSFVAITQMWWRRREQTLRIGSWYCMNGMTWVLGSLVVYALAAALPPPSSSSSSSSSGLRPYQVIFLFFGLVTVAVAVAMFYWMPDSPADARFLSPSDRILAVERLRDPGAGTNTNTGTGTGAAPHTWRTAHLREALADPKTWLWVALIFCISVPSNGISVFGPLIIKSFVADPFRTTLFNVPVGLSHVACVSLSAYAAMRWKRKGPVIALLCLLPILGCAVLLRFPHDAAHRAVLLAGYFCLSPFTGITPLIYAWSAQNTAGDTKAKCTAALVFIGSSAGNIVGPLLFTPDEAPAYARGLRANLAFFAAVAALAAAITLYLARLNAAHARRRVAAGKRARVRDTSLETAEDAVRIAAAEGSAEGGAPEVSETSRLLGGKEAVPDATDLENEDFLFVY